MKQENEWKYYKHAWIPASPPHEEVDDEIIVTNKIWKKNKNALLARWTTAFDCGFETNWWYVIKDSPFDLQEIKSKKRYVINKGKKNFYVKIIKPTEYMEELYEVFTEAYSSWPEKYRPDFPYTEAVTFFEKLSSDQNMVCYGAFDRTNNKLCGYAQLSMRESYAEFQILRVKPAYEKFEINAAVVYYLLEYNKDKLGRAGFYILDGARSISHETRFQEYLEKYFGFRRAYCKLHIAYNPKVKWIIKILYPFRKFLKKFDDIRILHQVNSVLNMEAVCRDEV